MKLLHVIASTDPESGGPIEALLRFSEVLLRDGHEVEVVSLDTVEEAAQRLFPFKLTAVGRGIGRYGYNPLLTSWVRKNAGRFDGVILHGLWNYSSVGAWRGLRRQSTPYYIFPHGMMDPWFRTRYRLKHNAKQIYWWLVEGRVLRDAKKVLFTCEEEKLRARNVFYGHTYAEGIASLGTADPVGDACAEKAAFYAAYPELKGKQFLLFLSRIHPKKGCDLLIQAFADTAAQCNSGFDLMIAGPDQVGWVPELKQIAERLGVASRVHWPGMLKGELKWGAFRAAEAMILPSHQENFGFAVAEAMACSTPVLVSDKVNIWREVEAAQAGLVEPDTFEGTRNLIRRFCSLSPEERTKMKRAARIGFQKHFVAEAATRELVQVIRLGTVQRKR
jgi:glycosyltransferase involved in cell wall biosynthesis